MHLVFFRGFSCFSDFQFHFSVIILVWEKGQGKCDIIFILGTQGHFTFYGFTWGLTPLTLHMQFFLVWLNSFWFRKTWYCSIQCCSRWEWYSCLCLSCFNMTMTHWIFYVWWKNLKYFIRRHQCWTCQVTAPDVQLLHLAVMFRYRHTRWLKEVTLLWGILLTHPLRILKRWIDIYFTVFVKMSKAIKTDD